MAWYYCCLAKVFRSVSIVILFATSVCGSYAQGVSVTFGWNANLERDVAGYRLYYGNDPRVFTHSIDVGNTVTATVANLSGGTVYYFAVTAYTLVGFESMFSNGVSYTVPLASPTPGHTPTPAPTA